MITKAAAAKRHGGAAGKDRYVATMNLALLFSTLAAVATAVGHSWLGETKILRPLYAERSDDGVLKPIATRRVLRAVFHMPSMMWASTGILTFGFVWHGTTPPVWFVIYGAAVYGISAVGNFWGLRRPHIGNILLTVAAATLVIGSL